MRRVTLAALSLLAVATAGGTAQAQGRPNSSYDIRSPNHIVIRVRPRSWLDAGRVVEPTSRDNPATSGRFIAAQYLNTPPYIGLRDRFGAGTLPDPITNGPFIGARNIFGPVDYSPFEPRGF